MIKNETSKGLDLPEYETVGGVGVTEVPVSELSPNPRQPRRVFDKDKLISLSESIKRYGILQPLSVRRDETGRLEIIAGERRWQAAKMAGFLTVPCILMDACREDSAALAIIENLQREDLNIFEEAAAISELIYICRLTQEEAASRLSVSQPYIANKLRMLRFTDEERALILESSLTERHARALLRLTDGEARMSALNHIIKHHFNVAETEKYIEGLLSSMGEAAKRGRGARGGQKIKYAIKDLRLFYNAIDHAADTLRGGGVPVKVVRDEAGGTVTITISVG
ncbi:MAG: ParB/RepB/Spo0J family partition protein [Firmicutes bacterium]|nr:ParB/RepB/Spo0J family partition protein [Bacillota bacterium]